MAVSVTINAPENAAISLPFQASVTIADDSAQNIDAAWYQVDDTDAIALAVPGGQTTVNLNFVLDGLNAGDHVVTVFGRTAADVNFTDQNFTVNTPAPSAGGITLPGGL